MRSSPNGSRADARATPATHATSSPVGTWTKRATVPPTTPAGSPAAIPHIITGPAAGTARRLAGTAATGSPPKTGTSTGATPSWAASVTASADAERPRPRQRVAEGSREQGDARARARREQEAHGSHEQRVDEEHPGDREREQAQARDGPAERRRHQCDTRHRLGTQHRRLPARDEPEEDEHHDGGREPATEAQPTEQRRGEREDERHVLPGDDEEVGEPRGPEVVDVLDRLLAVVTEHEAGEEGAAVVGERRGPGEQRAAHAVRQSGDGAAERPRADLIDGEARPDVPAGQSIAPRVAPARAAPPPRPAHPPSGRASARPPPPRAHASTRR